jgi:hypothetical protein
MGWLDGYLDKFKMEKIEYPNTSIIKRNQRGGIVFG